MRKRPPYVLPPTQVSVVWVKGAAMKTDSHHALPFPQRKFATGWTMTVMVLWTTILVEQGKAANAAAVLVFASVTISKFVEKEVKTRGAGLYVLSTA